MKAYSDYDTVKVKNGNKQVFHILIFMQGEMKDNKKIPIAFSLLVLALLYASVSYAAEAQKHNVKPPSGFVPDAETAIKTAVAVWTPIYGKEKIEKEKPYKATLKNGVWHIEGSLPEPPEGEVVKGGVAEAEIIKEDGKIIRISHGK